MPTTRRHFLKAAAATPALLAGQSSGGAPRSANDHIQVALIGAGGQGTGDAHSSIAQPGVKLVAVSDCYDGRLQRALEVFGKSVFITRDYREILARRDIDAVIIGTPDHWHRTISIDAMNAGKDVYCEKPMVQHVDDGKPVVDAWQKTNRIMQVGSQRVSSVVYQKAKDLLKSGAIGQLNMVEAWWDRNSAIGAWQYSIPPDANSTTCDWDRFQGRSPHVAWDPNRFFRWRN
jgi:predicted dehydrogenase